MERIQKYKEYRCTQKALFHKIIRFAEENYIEEFENIGKKLEFQIKNKKVCYSGEEEFAFLMDYFLMEHRIGNKTISQIYEQEIGSENEIEKEVLSSMKESYVSLYRTVNAIPDKSLVFLMDIINQVRNTRLTDMNFSKVTSDGYTSFTRILKFNDFSMTSGMTFVFNTSSESELFNGINMIKRNINDEEKKVKEIYKFIYKKNAATGNNVKMFQI